MMNSSVDLKALRAVHVLTTCGSVTKTAEILNISPGNVSYLLNKIRKTTGSALFCRTRKGMVPDNIAKELSLRYQNITQELYDKQSVVSIDNREVAICTYALIELIISTALADKKSYPKALKFSPPELNDDARLVRLRNKEIDIDIGTRLPADKNIIQVGFFSCGVKIAVRRDHPTIKDQFTLSDWFENSHVLWSRGMDLICDDYQHANRFDQLLNQRSISMVSSNALNMATLCAASDNIMLMPDVVLKHLEDKLPIVAFEPPAELQMRYDCFLHYHHSLANDGSILDILKALQDSVR